jgi:hypothetical protein
MTPLSAMLTPPFAAHLALKAIRTFFLADPRFLQSGACFWMSHCCLKFLAAPPLIGLENPLAIQPVFDPELMAEGCAFSFNITQNIEVFKT